MDNSKLKILVVEDEEAIRIGLIDVLIYHGYEVEYATDGILGLEKAQTQQFDLVLLDVMMPGLNGFEVCQAIRESDKELAIIMLTAKTTDEDVIHGLTLGADDYVSKPFSVAQLILRIQAVLRRGRVLEVPQKTIQLGNNINVDCLNLNANVNGAEIIFTRREMDLIEYLNQNNQRPVSREELLNKVWGYHKDLEIETRTVDIHIAKLRRKIEKTPSTPEFLVTVRGAGYKLLSAQPE
jgi:two-component system response regulator RegX3